MSALVEAMVVVGQGQHMAIRLRFLTQFPPTNPHTNPIPQSDWKITMYQASGLQW